MWERTWGIVRGVGERASVRWKLGRERQAGRQGGGRGNVVNLERMTKMFTWARPGDPDFLLQCAAASPRV